ncbi:MAG: CBS domain-containing protein [Candidatus Micrarchaeota archaeon]
MKEEMQHIVLDSEDTLAKAMSDIMQTKKAVVVTKNGEYFGMIDSASMRHISDDPNVIKAGHVAINAPVLTEQTSLTDTCKLFFTSRLKALPILDGKRVTGVLSFLDLLDTISKEKMLEHHRVSEVMSRPGVRIEENSTLAQAQALMRKNHVRRLIVTKGGALFGILSAYDMAEILLKPREKAPLLRERIGGKDLPIEPLVQKEVATVGSEDSLTEAANEMVSMNVASLVVVDGNNPVGVVTAHDILETVFAKDEPNVLISGLYGEHKSLYPDVIDIAKKELGKLERAHEIEYLTLHFKFDKKLCSVKARLMMENGVINASASDYVVHDAVKVVMSELDKITSKHKKNKMHEK